MKIVLNPLSDRRDRVAGAILDSLSEWTEFQEFIHSLDFFASFLHQGKNEGSKYPEPQAL